MSTPESSSSSDGPYRHIDIPQTPSPIVSSIAPSSCHPDRIREMHILITGAGRGIGRGLSRLFLEKGHRVFLTDVDSQELTHTAEKLSTLHASSPRSRDSGSGGDESTSSIETCSQRSGESAPLARHVRDAAEARAGESVTPGNGRFMVHDADLRKQSDIQSIAVEAGRFFDNRLDVLINNAAYTAAVGGPSMVEREGFAGGIGIGVHKGAKGGQKDEVDDFAEAWAASLEVNLTAPVMLSRAVLPMLRRGSVAKDIKDREYTEERGRREDAGCIVHISSSRAHQSEQDSEGYAATKAGLIGLTHSMAVSLSAAGTGVRVNAVLPGWINVANECRKADEEGAGEGWPNTSWEESGDMQFEDHEWHPAGRVGKVKDILRAVDYLIESPFITGQEITVDGGVGRKMVYPGE